MDGLLRGTLFSELAFCLLTMASLCPAATLQQSEYRGWKSTALGNDLVQVQITPEIGGRVIQVRLGDFEYLWVNPDLEGKLPPPSGMGPKGEWLNYGGSKLWPAPQGWESKETQWPGPPGAAIEGLPHQMQVTSKSGTTVSLALESPKDQQTGIQFVKSVSVADGAARVSFDLAMRNIDTKPRRWSIWQVTQFNAHDKDDPTTANEKLRVYCPRNPKSAYPRGYTELYGIVNNPAFRLDRENNVVVSSYRRHVGKIVADPADGWQAIVDGNTGYALVERFSVTPGADYCDGGPAEVWINGPGQFFAAGEVITLPEELSKTPAYVESEILSPMTQLQPGGEYRFRTDWYLTCLGGDYPILHCGEGGVVCVIPEAKRTPDGVRLSGRVGVFYPGKLRIHALDSAGRVVRSISEVPEVTPLRPIDLQVPAPPPSKPAPDETSVRISVVDRNGTVHEIITTPIQ